MLEYMWNLMWNSTPKQPNQRLKADLVTETLMEELNTRIKEADDMRREKESQLKREAGIPDYSWLISEAVKQYKIPNLLRIELEDLTSQIEPDDTRLIIENFRRTVHDDARVEEIPEAFKAILKRHLVTKNLQTVPKELDNLKTINTSAEQFSFFKKRPDLTHLREQNLTVNGRDREQGKDTRVNSAPATSWRFFRQSRIQPVDAGNDNLNSTSDNNSSKDRRANSVPTITTIV